MSSTILANSNGVLKILRESQFRVNRSASNSTYFHSKEFFYLIRTKTDNVIVKMERLIIRTTVVFEQSGG
jgi:hypothetical protein